MIPLLHLHGAIGAGKQFQPLVHEMHDFVNYSFDFEGHGAAQPTSRPFRIENFAENLSSIILHHNLAPARIVGYSMGGYVALWLAAHEPELIHSIITLGTKFEWSRESAEREVKFLNTETIQQKVPAFAQELQERHATSGWTTVLEKTKEMMLDLGENPRITPDVFAKVICPVRVGVGDRDTMVTLQETVHAFTALPNSELYVLPGTQHPLEKVKPARWAAQIRDFVKAHE